MSFHARTVQLHGLHLIEASAGTGKTWTIAALYARLVLEQGLEPELEPEPVPELEPEQELVLVPELVPELVRGPASEARAGAAAPGRGEVAELALVWARGPVRAEAAPGPGPARRQRSAGSRRSRRE